MIECEIKYDQLTSRGTRFSPDRLMMLPGHLTIIILIKQDKCGCMSADTFFIWTISNKRGTCLPTWCVSNLWYI